MVLPPFLQSSIQSSRATNWRCSLPMLALVVAAPLILWTAATATGYLHQPRAETVRLANSPWREDKVQMPPPAMVARVEALMAAGKVPKYRALPLERLKEVCETPRHWNILGCSNAEPMWLIIRAGAPVVIWEGLRGRDRHHVLVHEYAHYYGWKH